MAFNPDDKIQWENFSPTLQALLEMKIKAGGEDYFNKHIDRYINNAINSSKAYTDNKVSSLQVLLTNNKDDLTNLSKATQTQYTELKNSYNGLNGRLDGNEFVKSKDKANKIELKYEQKDGEPTKTLHAYVDGVEIPLGSKSKGAAVSYIERPDITTAKSAIKTGHSTPKGDDETNQFWRTIIWEDGWYQMHGDHAATDPNGKPIDILRDIPIYLKKNSVLDHIGDLYYFTNTIKYACFDGVVVDDIDGNIAAKKETHLDIEIPMCASAVGQGLSKFETTNEMRALLYDRIKVYYSNMSSVKIHLGSTDIPLDSTIAELGDHFVSIGSPRECTDAIRKYVNQHYDELISKIAKDIPDYYKAQHILWHTNWGSSNTDKEIPIE